MNYISDRCKAAEENLSKEDRLLSIDYQIDGIRNQLAYGLCNNRFRAKLARLLEERKQYETNPS